jgi:hypothetical protein
MERTESMDDATIVSAMNRAVEGLASQIAAGSKRHAYSHAAIERTYRSSSGIARFQFSSGLTRIAKVAEATALSFSLSKLIANLFPITHSHHRQQRFRGSSHSRRGAAHSCWAHVHIIS